MGHVTDRAIELYKAGRREEALSLAEQVLRDDPADRDALSLAGAVLFQTDRLDEAERLLRRLLAHHPLFAQGRVNLAVVLLARGAQQEAVGHLRVACLLTPGDADVQGRLANLLHGGGDYVAAARHMSHAARLCPTDPGRQVQLAVALLSHCAYAQAVEVLAPVVARNPDHADARNHLAAAWLSLGRPDLAEETLLAACPVPSGAKPAIGQPGVMLTRARLYRRVAAEACRPHTPEGLLVRAPFSVLSGYGDFAQHFVCSLMECGTPLRLAGLLEEESWRPAFTDPILQAAARRLGDPMRARLALSVLTPPLVEPIPGLPAVNYTMFEGPRIPASWAACNREHELVIVPTDSSRLAWIAAGHPEDRIRVCPPGIAPHPADASASPLPIAGPRGRSVMDYRVRVLNISDFVARKNLDGLLRVWLRATRADDDAILILKVGKGGSALAGEVRRLVGQCIQATGRRLEDAAPIALLTDRYDEAAIAGIYAMATHYFSLSHGEGWDLPITRAGCLGAGLIAPRHSAYTAYLNDRVAHLIPCTTGPALMPYSTDYYPPFHGLDWWHPDEDAAVDILARVIRDPEGERRAAARHLMDSFTWDAAARRLLDALDGVGR
ncbi:Flp pilus assembly protein TadD/glycosyltransferase involved in cell wall biosynthesis [Azospirillum lipoferum]|uniref:Tetratricopeptide repeat protein n=1 Tax=Azospirillum lipoferum TaxID=193 RepID=A0A5A9GH78_AZOLI|nr:MULTISPECIES: tetratricopeptide repeat protein [Azospirillum]KAA0593687.1 tetratricopeptide repeat protein [Azospirillum lipoferum]MCP1615053.1 Flp pilus assembly protein TadD/glycosyltransferase involved in cell wall biosynthesis [Azospirillum lipoferum]MDW5536958.1 tetratricopeptide repeat protein [Azospirillum sp. NL1]